MKKLLVIENDLDTLEITSLIFQDQYEVTTSTTRVPLEEIAKLSPNIIIVDYRLDDMLGSDICLEIKDNPLTRHIPVVLFSAGRNIEEIAHASCVDAFISKPFDIDDIVKVVNDLAL
jgi:two-component system phosphate regulon response regulator PhoB